MIKCRRMSCNTRNGSSSSGWCVKVVTLVIVFLLLHSSISNTPAVSSQLEKGNFHFQCEEFSSKMVEQEHTEEDGSEEENHVEGQSNMEPRMESILAGNTNVSIDEKLEIFRKQEKERDDRERQQAKLTISDALTEIDNISRGNGGTLCTTPSKMYRMFPNVPIGTHTFQVQKDKADLIASFLQLSREKTKSSPSPLYETEVNTTFNSLFAENSVENIRFVEDIPSSPSKHIMEKVSRERPLVRISKTGNELSQLPWCFNPNDPPSSMNKTKFQIERKYSSANENQNNNQDIRGYWTWPYFKCNGDSRNNHNPEEPIGGKWLLSYTVPFLMSVQGPQKQLKNFGLLSFDIDLSFLEINQCDFNSAEERRLDSQTNPLHAFRETHKCDRNTTTCQVRKRGEMTGWLKGNYDCRCNVSHYALYKSWNNSIGGLEAESKWCTTTQGNESHSFRDVVSCKPCPDGCPDCNDKHTCMADMNSTLRLTLLCISILCTLAAFGFIIVVCKFRKIPVFKTSSPIFICIMLSGCIIMYSEMIALYPVLTIASCIAVKWTRHLGFCITYTALALKLCRVYLTFRVKSAHKIKLTEKHLLHWMSPIMVIMLLYLFAWTISDPPDLELMKTVDDKRFYQCIYNWWDHALAIGEVIFLAYGVWICWKLRENPDAQFISYSIYNIALVNVLMVSFHLLILPRAGPDMKYVLAFTRTQLSTSTTIGLVIGSKLIRVWRGETASLKDIANSANGFGQETLDLAEENLQLKEELQKMATQIEKLKFYAMCKNNPHIPQLKQSSAANTNNAEIDFDSFSAL